LNVNVYYFYILYEHLSNSVKSNFIAIFYLIHICFNIFKTDIFKYKWNNHMLWLLFESSSVTM